MPSGVVSSRLGRRGSRFKKITATVVTATASGTGGERFALPPNPTSPECMWQFAAVRGNFSRGRCRGNCSRWRLDFSSTDCWRDNNEAPSGLIRHSVREHGIQMPRMAMGSGSGRRFVLERCCLSMPNWYTAYHRISNAKFRHIMRPLSLNLNAVQIAASSMFS